MADADRLKQVRSELESFQGGVGRFEMGMPAGWHYPMLYRADEVPPVMEKQRMMEALTGRMATVSVDVTDEDRAIIKKKLDTTEEATFDQWLLDQYRPWEHPAFKAYFLQKYPRFQEKMEEAIKKKAEFQLRAQVEALKDTPEGDMFRYEMTRHPELQTLLREPLGPESVGATATNVADQEGFQRGLLNPWKLKRIDDLHVLAGQTAGARYNYPGAGKIPAAYGQSAWGVYSGHFNGAPADAVERNTFMSTTRGGAPYADGAPRLRTATAAPAANAAGTATAAPAANAAVVLP